MGLIQLKCCTTDFWLNSGNPFGLGVVGAGISVNDEFDKEVSRAFEVGFKGTYLDGRLAMNGAYFNTNVTDNQFFEFFAGPWGLLRVVTTIDELDISGYELDFKYAVTDNLKIDGAFGITDGEIKENVIAHLPLAMMPFAPEHTFNLGFHMIRRN